MGGTVGLPQDSADVIGFDTGWLRAKRRLAIDPTANPAHKAASNLIVLNDDEMAPHTSFGHHHENIEIVSRRHGDAS